MKKLFLITCLIVTVASAYARSERGYYKDECGRLLVFRKQPSWWMVPGGMLAIGTGPLMAYGIHTGRLLASTHTHHSWGPFHVSGNSYDTTGDHAGGYLVCGVVSFGGMCMLYSWYYHHSRLNEPYVILDKDGMWYEGQGMLNWKDLKGVRLIEEPIRDGEGRQIGTNLLIEVVEIQKRWKIEDSKLAVTREALYDFILEYCQAATGKNPRIT